MNILDIVKLEPSSKILHFCQPNSDSHANQKFLMAYQAITGSLNSQINVFDVN